MTSSELISQSEFARRLGVTRQYVNKLIRLGKIEKIGTKVDFVKASAALKNMADPVRKKSSAPPPDPEPESEPSDNSRAPTFGEAKTMREIYNAKLARLRYEEESGSLIARDEVEDRARDIAIILKEGLLSLPTKMMEKLAVTSDPREINSILDAEVRDLLRKSPF